MTDVAAATRGVGVLLGLLGSIGINVGNNMQALGMGKIERQKRRDRRLGTPPPEETSGRASSSSGEPAACLTRVGAGTSTPATDLEDESSSSAEPEHPNVVALRSLKEPNAASPTRSHSLDAPSAARTADGPRCKDDLGVGVGRKNSKERDSNTSSFKDRPPRALVRTLTDSAMAITDSVGTLVPQLTPSLLSPRMGTLGSARGMESRGAFDSLDESTVEYAGRIPCVFGGQCIKTVGTIIFITGSVINFIAFALAPASILAPLESIQAPRSARVTLPLPLTLTPVRTLALVLTLTLALTLTPTPTLKLTLTLALTSS